MDSPGESTHVLKSFPKKETSSKGKTPLLVMSLAVILLGVGTGWALSHNLIGKMGSKQSSTTSSSKDVSKSDSEAGVADTSQFSDSEAPTGILQEGGINGEGNFHLERPGGASQNVYLTSTVIDLEPFVGKKVQVWGQTLSGQKAGWLMDVGKIKVVK